MNYTKLPLEAVPFSTAMARITVRLVQIHQRKHPELYGYPPNGVYALALWLRDTQSHMLHPWALSLAKELAVGWSMSAWREAIQQHNHAPRRLDKVPLPGAPRR